MSHGDKVTALPPGFKVIAANDGVPASPAWPTRRGASTPCSSTPRSRTRSKGKEIYARFVHDICGCGANWNMPRFVPQAIARIREQVGEDEVILGLSGGVDSAVAAALIHKAIGDQLTCIFVDTGLLRLDEGDQVMETFAKHLGVKVDRVNAADEFFAALEGVADPEAEAQDHRAALRRGVPARGEEASDGEMAGAGHDLSRRDRIGRGQDQEGGPRSSRTTTWAGCPRRCT